MLLTRKELPSENSWDLCMNLMNGDMCSTDKKEFVNIKNKNQETVLRDVERKL